MTGKTTATGSFDHMPEIATPATRAAWFASGSVAAVVLVIARILSPNPLGHGTHTQLGLPPCGFLVATGLPCPGCGLTTAFAHMARGEVLAATAANPFGVMLFLVTLSFVPIAFLAFSRSWPVVRTLDRLGFERVALLLGASAMVTWIARVAGRYFTLG